MDGIYDAPDGGDRMIFVEHLGPVTRLALGAFGATTLLAPWELLIRPGHPFAWAMLPFWFVSLGAVAVGLPLLAAAALGPRRTLIVDFERRAVVETATADFGLGVTRSRGFDDLLGFEVTRDDSTDGPPEWRVSARFRGARRPWPIRRLASEVGARALRAELDRRVAATDPTPPGEAL